MRCWLRVVLCVAVLAGSLVTGPVAAAPSPTGLPDGFVVETIADSLVDPTGFALSPDGRRIFISLISGKVLEIRDGVLRPDPLLDLGDEVSAYQGLLSIALHPDFPAAPWMYLAYSRNGTSNSRVLIADLSRRDLTLGTGLRSGSGGRYQQWTVTNRLAEDIVVSWLDYEGNRIPYATLSQGESYSVSSYEDHAWVLTRAEDNQCLRLIPAVSVAANFELDTQSANGADCAQQGAIQTLLGRASLLTNGNCGESNYITDCIPDGSHSIGALVFGADGSLFVGNGDAATFEAVTPQALRAQDIDSFAGKVLRVNPFTGQALIDNPFYDGSLDSNRSKVWAYGVRQPFRMAVDASGQLFVGDVGWNTWEEINRIEPGGNYGWPCYEGDDNGSRVQAAYRDDPDTSARCAEVIGADDAIAPLHAYGRGIGPAVILGDSADWSAFPSEYDETLFFGDNDAKFIHFLRADGTVGAFANNVGGVDQLRFGPDGALYQLNFFDALVDGLPSTGSLTRYRYVGAGNRPPIASIVADPRQGMAPLSVRFDGTGSSDADGDALSYAWAFGDGTFSTAPTPTHEYVSDGLYTVSLRVSDIDGASATSTTTIEVGAQRPTLQLIAPVAGSTYVIGDTLELRGVATDANGNELSDAIEWTILLRHKDHVHPEDAATGATGTYIVPDHGDETFIEVCAVVNGASGAQDSACVTLQPLEAELQLRTDPPNLNLVYEGVEVSGRFDVTSIIGSTVTISAPPQENCTFSGWADGLGTANPLNLVVTGPQTVTAQFDCGSPDLFCADESALHSIDASVSGQLRVTNTRREPIDLYWLNYSGQRVYYATIAAGGGVYESKSYLTHPWVLTDSRGHCLRSLTVDAERVDAILNETPPVPGPSCANAQSLRSLQALQSSRIEVVNETDQPIDLYWLNYSGQRVRYHTVSAGGGTVSINSYQSHAWLLADQAGTCLSTFTADANHVKVLFD